ncbi:hypothetical protein GQ472_06045 [archaeon]|nr:hypothetical protein [archaeon]
MAEYLNEISTTTSVLDVSIIKEEVSAPETLNLCCEAIGFVYNAIDGKEPDDESYLQNIYFGAKGTISLFEIDLGDNVFKLTQDISLSDLERFKKDSFHYNINDIKTIIKMNNNWKKKSFDIKKRYFPGLETILPNVFHIEDMPKLKPASIKIETQSLKNAINGHRNPGIFFDSLPKNVFDTLVAYNKEHHLGYKIYAG